MIVEVTIFGHLFNIWRQMHTDLAYMLLHLLISIYCNLVLSKLLVARCVMSTESISFEFPVYQTWGTAVRQSSQPSSRSLFPRQPLPRTSAQRYPTSCLSHRLATSSSQRCSESWRWIWISSTSAAMDSQIHHWKRSVHQGSNRVGTTQHISMSIAHVVV